MQISSVSSYKNYLNNSPSVDRKKFSGVSFCAAEISNKDVIEFDNERILFNKALSKLNYINKEEYDSLTEQEKKILSKKLSKLQGAGYKQEIKEDIELHQFAAEAIKKVLDAEYKRGNYVVITIGRSLSSISKLLEMKIGKENVKNIPMSSLRRFYVIGDSYDEFEDVTKNINKLKGIENFKAYLNKLGLSRQKINNSKKHYIIMDYTASGASLQGAYTVLTSDKLLGNDKRNIITASIADITYATSENEKAYKLDQSLNHSLFKRYSFVDSLSRDFDNIEDAVGPVFSDDTQDSVQKRKLFGFGLLDSEYSPKNKDKKDDFMLTPHNHKYPCQDKELWATNRKKYHSDVREDVQEIYKLIYRLEKTIKEYQKHKSQNLEIIKNADNETVRHVSKLFEESEYKMIKTQNFLKNMAKSLKKNFSLLNENDKMITDYYTVIRPRVLKSINTLNQRYSIEKCQKYVENLNEIFSKKIEKKDVRFYSA